MKRQASSCVNINITGTADLHIHTTASDGRLSPTQIIETALAANLSYIAITDHDTVDGLLELANLKVPIPTSLVVIPGIELSTDLPKNSVHILGYFIDIFSSELRNKLDILIAHRHDRTKQIIIKLNKLGYVVTYEQILEQAGTATSIGRPHIAKALVAQNYFSSIAEVFDTLLNENGPAYVPHYKLTPKEVIELISKAGGVPVLAHPALIGSDELVLAIIALGIKGIEVYHPKHDEKETQKYLELATKHELLITGGSDFHAIPARFPQKLGIFTVPAQLACQLQHNHSIKFS